MTRTALHGGTLYVDRLKAENERLHKEINTIRATFRVNMLRYGPAGTSHAEIDALLDKIEKEA